MLGRPRSSLRGLGGALALVIATLSCGGSPVAQPSAAPATAAAQTTAPTAAPAVAKTAAPAYPTQPLTMMVGWSAGSASDRGARALAESTQKYFGQSIVVQDMPGAGGQLAVSDVARAKPDGTKILFTAFGILTQPHMGEVTYKPLEDFIPIAQIGAYFGILVVAKDSPYKTMKDFIEFARANPGKIRWGTSGVGSQPYLAGRLLEEKAGVKMTTVPFNSGAEGIAAVVGGNVDAAIGSPSEAAPQIQSGTVRALGMTATERDKGLPNVPTMKEQGYDVVLLGWWAIAAPKGTPDYIVEGLHKAFKSGLESEPYMGVMAKMLFQIPYLGPKDTMETWKRDYEILGRLLKK